VTNLRSFGGIVTGARHACLGNIAEKRFVESVFVLDGDLLRLRAPDAG
jgi:hypothetical protein